ncbi:xylulokinase [Flavisolibacter ginsenosidimutans]|uniref:Carbohydrate kinase n=1 Tax=Flavisolibacter ginsenosidimutans TaxID=661481 RepID=A0A5B8UJZ5_9BACT|nr:FGGY family carbohydrate kinase [Flavisolibacter ginsenosidimutans]QEC56335.1 carbohydrate kinase [Flavisolibacter ginsenosidimutans]
MLFLGIDLGTSSVKVSVVDGATGQCIASSHYPETEADILAPQTGWAEQSPELWWDYACQAILKCNATGTYNPKEVKAIGIAYQMHGLVLVDKDQNVLRNAIIWCDGRAVEIGNKAFDAIGEEKCLSHLLNSPGNFTASKLAWVKEHEPEIYSHIHKILLPGDFIAMKLTGETTTTVSALSEGIFWDFQRNDLSQDVMDYFGFNALLIPTLQPLFSSHGNLKESVAERLSLTPNIPVAYKAGDQPNNAFSLNVLNPGEVAATAGTSGVIYGVSDGLNYDKQSRINSFAHVNYESGKTRTGVLLCINGCGIFNRWMRAMIGANHSYESLNTEAQKIAAGSNGLFMLPFGNGAERMLNNKTVGAHFHNLDFNVHGTGHLVRAAQEGIAFAFRYGLDIMRENGMNPTIIRAGKANLFLSGVFAQSFVDATEVSVELYQTDGSIGAALGAGVGIGFYSNPEDAFASRKPLKTITPSRNSPHQSLYEDWKSLLEAQVKTTREIHSINV